MGQCDGESVVLLKAGNPETPRAGSREQLSVSNATDGHVFDLSFHKCQVYQGDQLLMHQVHGSPMSKRQAKQTVF